MALSVLKHLCALLLILKSAELPQNYVSPSFSFGFNKDRSSQFMFLNWAVLAPVLPQCLLCVVLQHSITPREEGLATICSLNLCDLM